jgi:tetratricopeptide (TPR) repeat protein
MYEDGYEDSVTLADLLEDARYAEAEEVLAAFAAGYPEEAWPVSVRALCLAELSRHDEAIVAAKDSVRRDPAERGLAFDPYDEACGNLRALSLRPADSAEDWTEAVDDLLDRYPASAWARTGKGWGLLDTGRATEARETCEQALALDPTPEWAQHGLIESIKAANPLYAMLLRLFLWLDGCRPARAGCTSLADCSS